MSSTLTPRALPRRASLDAVLAYAWDAEVFTSGDALKDVGLTRSTTIEALDDLVALGLLRELPNARAAGEYQKGRPARRFAFDANAGVVVGLDAGGSHLSCTVADLRGETLAHVAIPRDEASETPASRRAAVNELIDATLAEAGFTREDALAVCVGVPAPVDRTGHSPVHREGFWETMNPGLVDTLAPSIPLVRIDNDANLAAVAERAVGAAIGADDFVALLSGERFGAGVCIDGRILHGAFGGVGEMVALVNVEGVGDVVGLGRRVRDWAREESATPGWRSSTLSALPAVDARDVLAAASAGDRVASDIADRAADLVARVSAVLTSVYGSARIVVCGAIAAGVDDVLERARNLVPSHVDMPAPTLVASPLGADVVAIGAVQGAVELARRDVLALLCTG